MVQIILGILIIVVLPVLFTRKKRRKADQKAFTLTCKILGGALILWGIVSYFN